MLQEGERGSQTQRSLGFSVDLTELTCRFLRLGPCLEAPLEVPGRSLTRTVIELSVLRSFFLTRVLNQQPKRIGLCGLSIYSFNRDWLALVC